MQFTLIWINHLSFLSFSPESPSILPRLQFGSDANLKFHWSKFKLNNSKQTWGKLNSKTKATNCKTFKSNRFWVLLGGVAEAVRWSNPPAEGWVWWCQRTTPLKRSSFHDFSVEVAELEAFVLLGRSVASIALFCWPHARSPSAPPAPACRGTWRPSRRQVETPVCSVEWLSNGSTIVCLRAD